MPEFNLKPLPTLPEGWEVFPDGSIVAHIRRGTHKPGRIHTPKTKQEVFDKVAAHLLKQNRQSSAVNPLGKRSCLYRGPDGTQCAVGCLIPDEMYSTEMEGANVSSLLRQYPHLRTVPEINGYEDFLGELQIIHDCRLPEEWPERLRYFAKEHGLTFTPEVAL